MRFTVPALILGASIVGCSDPAGPSSGILRVQLAVTGVDQDADGYEVQIGRSTTISLAGPGFVDVRLPAGGHSVMLGPMAANCATVGPMSLDVQISPADTAQADFNIACSALVGMIEITTMTVGADQDPDGYSLQIDGGTPRHVPSGGVLRFVAGGGTHQVVIGGVAGNCAVTGANPRLLPVSVGGLSRDTARTSFDVACSGITGAIRVTAMTSGPGTDLNGFSVSVGAGAPRFLGANSAMTITGLAPGTVPVQLYGIDSNCALAGVNPTMATIVVGDTTDVAFTLTCAAPAVLQVSAPATGVDIDPAYDIAVDAAASVPLSSNGTIYLTVAPGSHSITLGGLSVNCTVGGQNPVSASVVSGDTTAVIFPIACAPLGRTGVDVLITTSGTSSDSSYVLTICSAYCWYGQPDWTGVVPANGTVTIDLPEATYDYYLSDVAAGCTGITSGWFDIRTGVVTGLALDLSCTTPGTLRVTASTSGPDQDPAYQVTVAGGGWSPIASSSIASNGTASLLMPPGDHDVALGGISPNCTVLGPNPVTATVAAATTTDVQFAVTCVALGSVQVSAPTSGSDLPAVYRITVDSANSVYLVPGDSTTVRVAAGTHAIGLTGVPANCTVAGPNPVWVAVTSGGSTSTSIPVTCAPNPIVRVTVTTTGPNQDPSYLVGVDPTGPSSYAYSAAVPANGIAVAKVPPGAHTVWLGDVAPNCAVGSTNGVQVVLATGDTVDLAFTVVCW